MNTKLGARGQHFYKFVNFEEQLASFIFGLPYELKLRVLQDFLVIYLGNGCTLQCVVSRIDIIWS